MGTSKVVKVSVFFSKVKGGSNSNVYIICIYSRRQKKLMERKTSSGSCSISGVIKKTTHETTVSARSPLRSRVRYKISAGRCSIVVTVEIRRYCNARTLPFLDGV